MKKTTKRFSVPLQVPSRHKTALHDLGFQQQKNQTLVCCAYIQVCISSTASSSRKYIEVCRSLPRGFVLCPLLPDL